MLNLHVENLTSAVHRAGTQSASVTSNFNIGTLNGQQVQLGNHNTQVNNISLAEVVKQVAAGTDAEAKGLVRKLLENNTVAALVGAGLPALIGLLAG